MQCILILLDAFPSLSFNFLDLTWRALLSRRACPTSKSQVPKQCSSSSLPRYSSCHVPAGFVGGSVLPIFGDPFDLYPTGYLEHEQEHFLHILKSLTQIFHVLCLLSLSIFLILNHPFSFMLYYYLFSWCFSILVNTSKIHRG